MRKEPIFCTNLHYIGYNFVSLYLSSYLQDHADIGTGTRQSHLHGVSFPVQPDAIDALKQFKQGSIGYLQLVNSPLSLSLSLSLFSLFHIHTHSHSHSLASSLFLSVESALFGLALYIYMYIICRRWMSSKS